MEQHHASTISLWYRIIPPSLLAILTGLIYYPSLHYEFQFDDIANITKHFKIRHYELWDLLFSGTRWISYWLNSVYYKINKFNPFFYRLGNVVIHTTNGILIFFILLFILTTLPKKSFFTRNAFPLSFLTALLFLLHPVQTQTVSYVIQGQLEGVAATFSLSIIMCFLLLVNATHLWSRITAFLLFITLVIFSTGTKEIAIVTPALVLMVDWFFVARGSWLSLKNRLILHSANTMMVVGMYVYLLKPKFFMDLFGLKMAMGNNLGNVITPHYDQMITPPHFFISQFKVILHYLWIFIWPFNISVEYDWVLVKSIFSPDCLFPFVALFILAFILYKLLQQSPTNIIGFAALWFAINIIPRSSIIPSPELLVDYKTYLASVGWLFIIATVIIKIFDRLKRHNSKFKYIAERYYLSSIMTTVLIALLCIGTVRRNMVWQSGLDFWGNIVLNAPGKARVYNNYGVELSQKLGKFADSIPYFQQAIKMDKNYRDPYNNLAVAYASIHQIDRAIETLQLSLKINNRYPEAYNNIASFLLEKKDYEQAKIALAHAIGLRPHYGKAYFNLGRLFMEENEPEKACEAFKKACMEADFDTESGFFGYAQCCLHLKKYEDAVFALNKVLECNPDNYDASFNRANAYYMMHDYQAAISAYQELSHKNPQDLKVWYNLAEAYFSAGNVFAALAHFERLKHIPVVAPNLHLRIAACYEKLGNPRQAKVTLEELLRKKLPDVVKDTVRLTLHKLVEQYHLV